MSFKEGSFEWYCQSKQDFFKYLCECIMRADKDNIRKLRKIFPHITEAHAEYSWMDVPDTIRDLTINSELKTHSFIGASGARDGLLKDKEKLKNINKEYKQGSFSRYLLLSGHFVSAMSQVIFWADELNLPEIEKEYPQMVAAYKMDDWNEVPSELEPIYNA